MDKNGPVDGISCYPVMSAGWLAFVEEDLKSAAVSKMAVAVNYQE